MRALLLFSVLLLAGCPGSLQTDTLGNGGGSGSGSGAGSSPSECNVNSDCIAAGAKCCDCPTHAVPKMDPAQKACTSVNCQPMSCGSPMQAVCSVGKCELECAPVQCDMAVSCADGFATDGNGCLTCACAPPPASRECSGDQDCARVRNDCCGCANGGKDTSIPVGQVASHDAALNCSANPSCPGVDTCPPDLAPRCVEGSCALVSGLLPQNACGRADLPACTSGQRCTVNANDQATMYGVGVCQP
jgi:hypothetical protein